MEEMNGVERWGNNRDIKKTRFDVSMNKDDKANTRTDGILKKLSDIP